MQERNTGALVPSLGTGLGVPQTRTAVPTARNPATVYLAGLAATGERSMRSALSTIAQLAQPGTPYDAFPWHLLRWEHTQAIRRQLVDRYAPRTADRMLSALRGVLRTCWRQGLMTAEDYQRVVDFKSASKDDTRAGRSLDRHEIELLVAAAKAAPGIAGLRNAAVVASMVGAGLRRIEIARMSVEDLDRRRGEYRVRGKGNKLRTVPIAPDYFPEIDAWCRALGRQSGPLFPQIRKSGIVGDRALSADGVGQILRDLREGTGHVFTPHDLRRTFATWLLEAGNDLAIVKTLMGHASVQTTSMYDRRGDAHLREAVASIRRPAPFGTPSR